MLRLVKFITWNNTFNNASMHIIDARCKPNNTLRIIKYCIKASKEWFPENPFINIIILEWNETFIT
jgi:hypothetical protein